MPRYTQPRTGYNKPLLPVPVSKFVDGLPVYGSTTETSTWRVYVPPPYIPPPYRRRWPDGERVYPLDRSELLERNAERPINQMPPEVLAEIFLKFLEDDEARFSLRSQLNDSARPLVSRQTDADPILLGQVCSYWRAVSLTTPMLWAKICILHPKRSHLQLVQLWLERAGTQSLDLYVLEDREPSQADAVAARDLMLSFAARRQYWHSIFFNIATDTLSVIAPLLQSQVSLEHINSVELHLFNPSKSGPITHTYPLLRNSATSLDDIWNVFHSSPTLRRVNWGYAYKDLAFPAHSPGQQLRDITLDPDISLGDLLGLLALCPLLEEIRIKALCLPSFHLDTSSSETILLSRLHSLNVTVEIEAPLLQHLTLPALRSLQLHYLLPARVSRDPHRFRDFLARSNCVGLHKFHLTDNGIKKEELCGYLESSILQNVEDLCLDARITDDLARRLTFNKTPYDQPIMPSLQSLVLRGCTTSDGVLSEMIFSRWSCSTTGSRSPIKQIWVSNESKCGLIDEREFSRMRQGGLHINVAN